MTERERTLLSHRHRLQERNRELCEANENLRVERDAADVLLPPGAGDSRFCLAIVKKKVRKSLKVNDYLIIAVYRGFRVSRR
jgi:predicted nucleic acid-binding protein